VFHSNFWTKILLVKKKTQSAFFVRSAKNKSPRKNHKLRDSLFFSMQQIFTPIFRGHLTLIITMVSAIPKVEVYFMMQPIHCPLQEPASVTIYDHCLAALKRQHIRMAIHMLQRQQQEEKVGVGILAMAF
jgi:hypothetical protein